MINFHHSNWKIINLFDSNLDYEIKQNARDLRVLANTEAGYSLVELLIVILIIMIMTALAIFPFIAHRNAYRTEDQALRIMDFMREAQMSAVAGRRIMRFEIDFDSKILRVIDEKTPEAGASDPHTNDTVIRHELLNSLESIKIGERPAASVSANPVFVNYAINFTEAIPFASNHPLSLNHQVWAVRFRPDGSTVNVAATTLINADIFLWTPDQNNSTKAKDSAAIRAVTVVGATSQIKLWLYDGTQFTEW
jgi:competence protein ComGC